MRNLNAEKTAELLLAQDNILILTHRNPDGDTLGSAFALLRALRAAGKTAGVLCADELPQKYAYMWAGLSELHFEPQFVTAVDIADEKLWARRWRRFTAVGWIYVSTTTCPIQSMQKRCSWRNVRQPVN